jgi:hypothetical protein
MFDTYKTPEAFKEKNGYTIGDVWYPRVTSIVSIKSKPALNFFYAEQASYAAARSITEKSADEGTRLHEAVQAIMLGKEPVITPEIAAGVEAFRKFREEHPIETQEDYIERRIWHPEHRYAGTVDVIGMLGGKFGVLDIKTSLGIYRDYNLQTAAYMEALLGPLPELQTRWILRIDQAQKCKVCGATRRTKGGREKIRKNYGYKGRPCFDHDWGPVEGLIELEEFPNWRTDFQGFLGAKQLWEWEHEEWLKKIGY